MSLSDEPVRVGFVDDGLDFRATLSEGSVESWNRVANVPNATMSLKLSVTLVSGFLALAMVPAAISHGYADATCQCHLAKHKPVCGSDGRTYSNTCEAACNYVNVKCFGPCPCSQPVDCICPLKLDPVCGSDGETYGNQCLAICANKRVVCKGRCDVCLKSSYSTNPGGVQPKPKDVTGPTEDYYCPHNFDPVCGSDGKTYSNQCQATRAHQRVVCKGRCDVCLKPPHPTHPGGAQPKPKDPPRPMEDYYCAALYDPVCGSDGVTYGNDCEATHAHQRVVCKGRCDVCLKPPYPTPSTNPGGVKPKPLTTAGQKPSCLCLLHYEPVCGSDRVTYGNQCEANCAGKRVVCEGSCDACLSPYPTYPRGFQPRPINSGPKSRLWSNRRPRLPPVENKMI